MTTNRSYIIGGVIVAAVGLLLAAVAGLWGYMALTATPIHPTAQDVRSVAASAPSPQWIEPVAQARQLVRASLTEQNLPGLSVAVAVGGDIVWAEGFGWADLENRVPVAPDTRFRIGSASKLLTSAAVGLLIEEGRLRLDDEIQVYVPSFPKKQWPVTLRQLLGHLGGLRKDEGDEEPRSHCEQTLDGLQRFADFRLLYEPGTRYHYSNYGWILVSAAVEAAAAQPFPAFMRTRVFEPLNLDHTRAESASESIAAQAVFYFPRFAADPRYGPQDPEQADYSCFSGSSAFLSTPSDLVRFATAIDRGKLLQPATVRLLQTSQRLTSGAETGYGLGWDLETVDLAGTPTRVVGADGELAGGPVASLMAFPERDIVVAVISNTAYADTPAIALKIAQVFARPRRSAAAQTPDRR